MRFALTASTLASIDATKQAIESYKRDDTDSKFDISLAKLIQTINHRLHETDPALKISTYTTYQCIEKFLPSIINTLINVIVPDENGKYPKTSEYVNSVMAIINHEKTNPYIDGKLTFTFTTPLPKQKETTPKAKAEKAPKPAKEPKAKASATKAKVEKEAKPAAKKAPKAKATAKAPSNDEEMEIEFA